MTSFKLCLNTKVTIHIPNDAELAPILLDAKFSILKRGGGI